MQTLTALAVGVLSSAPVVLIAEDWPRGAPTVDGRRVYALGARGDLTVLDAESGERVWGFNISVFLSSDYGTGCALLEIRSDGLVEASREGYRESGRFEPSRSDEHSRSHPVIADGKLYLRDQDTLCSFDVRRR